MHRANGEYYSRIAPELFRPAEADGLAEFMDPGPDANTETTLALVAEVEGAVVGCLEARLEPPLESARYQNQRDLGETRLFINYVGTHPSVWRRGVASRLVAAAEEWGRERGAVAAVCDTYVGSPVSVPFWEAKLGYERRAIIFRKPLR